MISRRERGEHSSSHMLGFLSDRGLMQYLERRSDCSSSHMMGFLNRSWARAVSREKERSDCSSYHMMAFLNGSWACAASTGWRSWSSGSERRQSGGSQDGSLGDCLDLHWSCCGVSSALIVISLFSLMLICDLCNLMFISPFKSIANY